MIHIKCGTCGTSQGYKTRADGTLTLPAAEERRLVARGVADYVTRPIIGPAEGPDSTQEGVEEHRASQDTPSGSPPAEAATEDGEAEPDEEANAEIARLERMQRADLEQMAADLDLDFSDAKNKHDLAVLIAAADEPNDDALPELSAGDIVQ